MLCWVLYLGPQGGRENVFVHRSPTSSTLNIHSVDTLGRYGILKRFIPREHLIPILAPDSSPCPRKADFQISPTCLVGGSGGNSSTPSPGPSAHNSLSLSESYSQGQKGQALSDFILTPHFREGESRTPRGWRDLKVAPERQPGPRTP